MSKAYERSRENTQSEIGYSCWMSDPGEKMLFETHMKSSSETHVEKGRSLYKEWKF